LSFDGALARVGWVYFIARAKGSSASWVTRMWEGKIYTLEKENGIKIN
jgi:hypothetical protein